MALRMLSSAVAKRFPSYQHLVQVFHEICQEISISWCHEISISWKWQAGLMTEKELERFQVVEKLTCDAGHQAGCHHHHNMVAVVINNMVAIIIIVFIAMTIFVTIIIVINWGWSDHLDSNPLGSKAPSTSLERGAHLWGTSLSRSQQVQQLWWRSCFSITQMEILHFAGTLLIWGTKMETFSA